MPRQVTPLSPFPWWDVFLIVLLVALWLGITMLIGAMSLLIWGLGLCIASVLVPAHQRTGPPDSVVDVVSAAICWAVAMGIGGLLLDLVTSAGNLLQPNPWTLLGQVAGFYLGLVWAVVVVLVRNFEQSSRGFDRPRPLA